MKPLTLARRIAAALSIIPMSVAFAAQGGSAPIPLSQASTQTSTSPAVDDLSQFFHSSILFMRTNWRAFDSSSDTVLYRVKPSGDNVVPLTPVTYHVDYRGGSWSPTGGSVVYERDPQATSEPSQLFVVDRQGSGAHQITTGSGVHTQEAWGPRATIAFITTDSGAYCLAAVRADGTHQRILFCPPHESGLRDFYVMSTPQWTPSGKSVLVDVGAYEANLEPRWFSRVYRVSVGTGTAVKLTEQVFGDPDTGGDAQTLAIAPDGKHGVYAKETSPDGALQLIDLTTGTRTPLAVHGQTPLYSKDGSKIAFIQHMATSPYSSRVFVMGANGDNPQPAMANPDPEAYYTVADWSQDGTRLLVNKVANDRLLQIVNLATGAATTVTKGTSFKDDWYQP